MWTEVYVSQKSDKVKRMVEKLYSAKIIAKVRRFGNDNGDDACFEVLVPGTELEEAQSIVVDSNLI